MSHGNQSSAASDLAGEFDPFEKNSDTRPRLRARVAAWAYNIFVVSLMAGTMIVWACLTCP